MDSVLIILFATLLGKSYECTKLLDTPPVGLSCIHCSEPIAQKQARVLTKTLLNSCIKRPATNYLVDGSFKLDLDFITGQIEKLTSGGREPVIEFYLSNGPRMRRISRGGAPSEPINVAVSKFRRYITHPAAYARRFQAHVATLVPMFRFAIGRGATVLINPQLEDNLSDKEWGSLMALITPILADLPVRYVRNPCRSCYPGNGGGIPRGVMAEAHSVGSSIRNGLITNDGDNIATAKVPAVIRQCRARKNFFIHYDTARAGRRADLSGYVAPSKRHYAIPGIEEQKRIINFLRTK